MKEDEREGGEGGGEGGEGGGEETKRLVYIFVGQGQYHERKK